MFNRDVYFQTSIAQGYLHSTSASGSWATGISNDYRSYNPANSKFANVATTRASVVDPQRSFANFYGLGRFSIERYWYANSSSATTSANRISYLAPSASRPKAYIWRQTREYTDPTKAELSNQAIWGLNFYRLSNGNNVVVDQFTNSNNHWIWYNQTSLDNNLLTLSSAGAISKIEAATEYQDNPTSATTPLLFQTHGGIPADTSTTWRTDYSRDAQWQTDDRDTYIWYRPNFGSNKQLPEDVETLGEWGSNGGGGRSGS